MWSIAAAIPEPRTTARKGLCRETDERNDSSPVDSDMPECFNRIHVRRSESRIDSKYHAHPHGRG